MSETPFLVLPCRRSAPLAELAVRTADRMLEKIPSAFRECAAREVAAPRLSYSAGKVALAAADLFDGKIRTVTFHGLSGAGKTTGAALFVGELARLVRTCFAAAERDPLGRSLAFWDYAVEWAAADDIVAEADYADPKEGEPELARAMRVAPIAIVDDIGNERGRFAGSNGIPVRIVQARYNVAELYTVVTSGLTSKETEDRWGIGFARRLADTKNPRHRLIGAERSR